MDLLNCSDKAFKRYGFEVTGYDFKDLFEELSGAPCPKDSVVYKAEYDALQNLPVRERLQNNLFGGMPVQLGYCNGHSVKLNCLEYHRGSEFIAAGTTLILLLMRARRNKKNKN